MHRYLILVLLIACVILPACSMRRQGIREVTLRSGGMGPNHTVNNYSVTFRRDGTAEMVSGTISSSDEEAGLRPASPDANSSGTAQNAGIFRRAKFSTDRFERLAATLDNNGFFSKDEQGGMVMDAWQNLSVVSTTGEKTIQTLGRDDPQIKTMIAAIDSLSHDLQWEDVKR